MSASSAEVVDTKSHARSRISNGSSLFGVKVDGRSVWARRLRDLINLHLNELGGENAVSAAKKSIIRRAATLTVELERLEANFALAGQATPQELDLYQRAAGNLRRLLKAIGLERHAKPIPHYKEEAARLMQERRANPPPPEPGDEPYVEDEDVADGEVVETVADAPSTTEEGGGP